jgi:hypothetical protein
MRCALDFDRVGGMLGEHYDPVILWRACRGDRERSAEFAQVERILDYGRI